MITATDVKTARKKLGESQAVFGARFGVDQSTVHRWETKGVPGNRIGAARMAVESLLATLPVRDDDLKTQTAQAE
jgi:transcriptional regulator with XRE-family HTH domain